MSKEKSCPLQSSTTSHPYGYTCTIAHRYCEDIKGRTECMEIREAYSRGVQDQREKSKVVEGGWNWIVPADEYKCDERGYYACSECHKKGDKDWLVCPYCMADMRKWIKKRAEDEKKIRKQLGQEDGK